MSNLVAEILLRLAKAAAAGVLGLLVYLVVTGPLGEPGSATLALLCWISGVGFVLVVQESPL